MNTAYTPYTYLIGWSSLNLYYYGVRHATKTMCLYESGCHPDDLFVTYFTSSKKVAALIVEHGYPDVRMIRQTFSTREAAVAWEHKCIRRMGCVTSSIWLNEANGKPNVIEYTDAMRSKMSASRAGRARYISIKTGESKTLTAEDPLVTSGEYVIWSKGSTRSSESKSRQSETVKGEGNHMYGQTHSDEARDIISAKSKQKFIDNPQLLEDLKLASSESNSRRHYLTRERTSVTVFDASGDEVWKGNKNEFNSSSFPQRLKDLLIASHRSGKPIERRSKSSMAQFVKEGLLCYLGWSCTVSI